jgi:hypothetical protein
MFQAVGLAIFGSSVAAAATDPGVDPGALLNILTGISGPAALALIVIMFSTGRWVRGSELEAAQKQVADLQEAMLEKVIPAVTEANVTMRLIARDPRRSE